MRPLITASTWGYLYILHFSAPLGNPANPRALATHYCGWAADPDERLAQHLAGRGAKITAAAVARGITFEMFSWPAPLGVEKALKRRKETPRFCPTCCSIHGWKHKQPIVQVAAQVATQLALPLDDPFDPFPAPAALPMDSYEFLVERGMRTAWAGLLAERSVGTDWDDAGLL